MNDLVLSEIAPHWYRTKPRTRMTAQTPGQFEHFRRQGWLPETRYNALPANWAPGSARRGHTVEDYLCRMNLLKDRLLALGGWGVCLVAWEPDLDALLSRGEVFPGASHMMRGEPCQCHANVAALYLANRRKIRIATGYALSRDGIWRQHSWGVLAAGSAAGPHGLRARRTLIETTVKRVRYYGVMLSVAESERFADDNDF